mgnify:CR=1 FL=1
MLIDIRSLTLAAAGAIVFSAAGHASTDPSGVWFDPERRGAVEIAPCANGKGYCGFVVHIADAKNAKRCGLQILGNVTAGGGGWIYSPDRGRRYTVALKRLSDDRLRVVGNAGSFFSKTFTWTRAPEDVARCGGATVASPAKPAPAAPSTASASSDAAKSESVRPVTTGATSPSVALLGKPMKRATEARAEAAAPAPASPPPPAEPVAAPKAEAATASASAEEDAEVAPEPRRMCKFKIPYVGRVIDIPCRD